MRRRDIALVVGLVVVVALVFFAGPILAHMGYGGLAYRGYGYGRGFVGPEMMYGFGFLWPLVMLVFWIVIIAAGVTLVGRAFSRGPVTGAVGGPAPRDSALEVLRERYARGEITKDQFDQMRRDLTSVAGS